jgi:hypothetical protein
MSLDCIQWAKEIRDRSWLLYTSCQIGLCLAACYLAPFQGCKSNTFAGEKRGLWAFRPILGLGRVAWIVP